jgi:hypothetical protein
LPQALLINKKAVNILLLMNRMAKLCPMTLSIIFAVIFTLMYVGGAVVEGFAATSPGTTVQLQTSHVPTEEDEEYMRKMYPRIVNRDLKNMTGEGLFEDLSDEGLENPGFPLVSNL